MCTALSPPPHHATRPPPATHAIPMIAFGTPYDCVFFCVWTSHDFNAWSKPPDQTTFTDSHATALTLSVCPVNTSSFSRGARCSGGGGSSSRAHEKPSRGLGVVAVVTLATLPLRLLRLPPSRYISRFVEGKAGVAVPHANGVVVPARRDAFAPGRRGDALHGAFVPDEERRLVRDLLRDAPLRVHLDAPGAHDAVVAAGDDDAAGASRL